MAISAFFVSSYNKTNLSFFRQRKLFGSYMDALQSNFRLAFLGSRDIGRAVMWAERKLQDCLFIQTYKIECNV